LRVVPVNIFRDTHDIRVKLSHHIYQVSKLLKSFGCTELHAATKFIYEYDEIEHSPEEKFAYTFEDILYYNVCNQKVNKLVIIFKNNALYLENICNRYGRVEKKKYKRSFITFVKNIYDDFSCELKRKNEQIEYNHP
jgi:hypothetical protein